MTHAQLVTSGLLRDKARTSLTLLSVVIAFLLFAVLNGITAGFDRAVNALSDDRIRTQNRASQVMGLPLSYVRRIELQEGIQAVTHYSFFGGYIGEPTNSVPAGAVDIEKSAVVFPELNITPEMVRAMRDNRTGVVVGRELAEKFGWKVGDRIPLRSGVWQRQDGSDDWGFVVTAIYGSTSASLPANEIWLNYDYLDGVRTARHSMVSAIITRVHGGTDAAQAARRIDDEFQNGAPPTVTRPEKDFVRAQIRQLGDLEGLVRAIVVAVMFTLMFVIGNAIMRSAYERSAEFAVLRTLGFSAGVVGGLVAAEAVAICVAGAVTGISIAAYMFPAVFSALGVGAAPIPAATVLSGILLAIVLGVFSGLIPVARVASVDIATALRRA